MDPTHGLTVHFIDAGVVRLPDQAPNEAARQLRLEEFMKGNFLMVIADGVFTMLPVANIKAIQMPVSENMKKTALPKHVIRGAMLARGDF
jgi:hypothetical protein